MADSNKTRLLKLSYPNPGDPVADGAEDIGRLAQQVEAWGGAMVTATRAVPNMNVGTMDPAKPWAVAGAAISAQSDANGLISFTIPPFVCVASASSQGMFGATDAYMVLHNAGHDGGLGRVTFRCFLIATGAVATNKGMGQTLTVVYQRR